MKKGFTLIELLVVVLIIGILSAVAMPQYTRAVEKSRATQAMTLVKSIADAQKIYYMANGTYARNFEDLDISMPGNPTGSTFSNGHFTYEVLHPEMIRPFVVGRYIKNGNFTWRINYYLDTEKLVCAAPVSDAEANNLCKSFSTTVVPCVSSDYTCYAL
ncbi:MAG: prepilin-type N-terminal cleavage/methylation domain-containing protein [Elusimicrobiaceae bacterium]|nr:prepilin-type N-terminal cleavage/methylation domain-containing protein [Elusimicrobiaceae bacterium]